MSDLVEYAKSEMRIAGLENEYGGMLFDSVVKMVEQFADEGHSGFSANMDAVSVLTLRCAMTLGIVLSTVSIMAACFSCFCAGLAIGLTAARNRARAADMDPKP